MKFLVNILIIFPIFLNSQSKLESSIENGKSIYNDFCLRCHLSQGEGVEGIYPPLAKSDYLFKNIKQSIMVITFSRGQEKEHFPTLWIRGIKLTDD